MRKLSYYSLCLGVLALLAAAIWAPTTGETVKWAISAAYLILVGRFFGVTYKSERVTGSIIERKNNDLNFLNLRKK